MKTEVLKSQTNKSPIIISYRRYARHLLVATMPLLCSCSADEPSNMATVKSINDMGSLETNDTIRGRDGGYSTSIFGKSVWLYGDTVLSINDEEGISWHNSSASWTDDMDASDGITGFSESNDSAGAPRVLFEYTAEELKQHAEWASENPSEENPKKWAFWPGKVVYDAENDQGLLFYGKVIGDNDGGFDMVGVSLATWKNLEELPKRVVVRPDSQHPTQLFSGDEPRFGEGSFIHDSYLYTYDCAGKFDKPCIIARVRPKDAFDRSEWRFWDGDEWQTDWKRAEAVLEGHDIMSVHYSPFLEGFIAVYSKPLSNDVAFRTAPSPEGPWSEEVIAFTAKSSHDGGTPYSGLAHAEYAHDNYEYFSYHRGTKPWEGEIRMIQVELKKVDGTE